jgi:hypothetical protein
MTVGATAPNLSFSPQRGAVFDPSAPQTLSGKQADRDLGLVQPTAVFGCVVNRKSIPQPASRLRERWLTARQRELLNTSHFHVVFTVPHELNVLALENPRLFYDLLFTASAQTLLEIASDPKHLGAEIGVIAILHT